MTGDFFAAADPDVRVLHDVFEKASECADTSRSSYHAAVHRHRQKFRRRRSFGVKPIEGIAHVGKPVVGCRETPAWAEASVVGVEGVADNEVSLVANCHPVWKVVIDGVAVVQEAAVLDHKPPRVNARPSGKPAQRATPRQPLDRVSAPLDVLTLNGLWHVTIVDPAPAVSDDVVAAFGDQFADRRVALQRKADAVHSQRYFPLAENAQDSPDAGATPELIRGFGIKGTSKNSSFSGVVDLESG